jgi:ABC-2 type transport system ATP-binding protein
VIERRALAPGQTHVIATNQLAEAEQLCDRVLIINRGTVIASGTIAEIRGRFQSAEHGIHRITYRGALPEGLAPGTVAGLVEVEDEGVADGRRVLRVRTVEGTRAFSSVLQAILLRGGTIERCETRQVPFDDVFCGLVLADQQASREERAG